MNELLKILSKVFEEEKLKENGDKLKNLTDLYNLCMSKGYEGDIATFESEYKKLVEQCSDILKISEISDFDLECISGGVNNTFKSSIATLMTALSLSGSASSMVSAVANNSTNQNSVIQEANEWIKSKYNTVSEKTNKWLKARSKNEITAMKVIGGITGVGLVSAPVIVLATKNSNNYKNVQTLVFLIVNSKSYMNTSDSKKSSLIKKAYSELGLQINQQETINTDIQIVKNKLILAIKKKIENLRESDKKHKGIEILVGFLKLMQPIQSQSNISKRGNNQNSNNTPEGGKEQNLDNTPKDESEQNSSDVQLENAKQDLKKAKKLVVETMEIIIQNNYKTSENRNIKNRANFLEDCLEWLDIKIDEILSRKSIDTEDSQKIYKLAKNIKDLTDNINEVKGQNSRFVEQFHDSMKADYMENEEFLENDDNEW